MNPELIKSLEEVVNRGLQDLHLPYIKGNSIRIKDYVVRKRASNWIVFNCETNTPQATFFSKAAAIALAKSLAHGRHIKRRISELDKIIQKNYTDCLFYKNALTECNDIFKREITRTRYEDSFSKTKIARSSLNTIIFQ